MSSVTNIHRFGNQSASAYRYWVELADGREGKAFLEICFLNSVPPGLPATDEGIEQRVAQLIEWDASLFDAELSSDAGVNLALPIERAAIAAR